jgi:hypothetical protein
LPLTLRRRSGDGRSRTDIFLVASEALVLLSYIPEMRTGGVEPPQREATGLQPAELANAQRPRGRAADRDRTGTAGITTPGACRYTTATMSSSSSAGGIRTHGLELMRLARTAGLLYRASRPGPRPIWLAGVEPAISGAQSRWGGQSPLQPVESTTVESNHARPPHQSGAIPVGCRRVSPGGVEPPSTTVGAWRSSAELRRESALDGNRTRLTRETARSHPQTRARACTEGTPSGIRTRVAGVRDRHPRSARRPGRGKLRRLGSNQHSPGNSRASCRLNDVASCRRRQQDSNLRAGDAAYAIATRCLASSAMPPRSGRRGNRTPKTCGSTRFRDGIPRPWQSFREHRGLRLPGGRLRRPGGQPASGRDGPGRRRTCNPPLKRRELCRLSYGASM